MSLSSARPTRTTARFGSWIAVSRPVTPPQARTVRVGGASGRRLLVRRCVRGRRQLHRWTVGRAEVHGDRRDDGDERLTRAVDEQAVAAQIAQLEALRRRLDHGVRPRDQRTDHPDIVVSSRPNVSC